MAKHSYTDAERAAALAVLQANGGNMLRTSKATGIPRTTLITWAGDVERQARMPEVERARFDRYLRRQAEAPGSGGTGGVTESRHRKRPDPLTAGRLRA